MKKNKNPFGVSILIIFIFTVFLSTFLFNKSTTNKIDNIKTEEISNFNMVDEKCINVKYNEFKLNLENKEIDNVYIEFNNEDYSDTFYFTKNNDKNIYITQNPSYNEFKCYLLDNDVNVLSKVKIFNVTDIEPKLNIKNKNNNSNTLLNILSFIMTIMGVSFIFKLLTKDESIKESIIGIPKDEIIQVENTEKLTFDDIGGLHELKKDLKCVVDFIADPRKYTQQGAELPKGILLIGEPGTGKTLIAKVMANEANVNFINKKGSDFVEKYVGTGAARIRQVFKEARRQAPCILFIDEIDSLCRGRDDKTETSEDRKTLTAFLAEMDGFKPNEGVIVIGATNRIEDMDDAALRPGRFTDIYTVPLPETMEERLEIINIYAKNKKFAEDFNKIDFAKEMCGRSPAQIKAVLNTAAIISVQQNKPYIDKKCIEEAFYKQIMKGHQKDNNETHPDDLRIIAYHEAGHTLVSKLCGNSVSKVTIIPSTNGAGGVTFIQPNERKLYTKEMMENKVKELYAGKVAEYLLMNKNWNLTTNGCSNDIEQATKILKTMVDTYGMYENGLVNLNLLSSQTSTKSQEYIIKLSEDLKEETITLLSTNKDLLDKLANTLLEKETIYENEINEILNI